MFLRSGVTLASRRPGLKVKESGSGRLKLLPLRVGDSAVIESSLR